eukprot:GHVU01037895.1.p1 GENE.GHVU01037895.1~~GHVU01037895.1.p1  ORF type:complete len:303 (+),score=38.80 GHVU01037895.1:119-1027(+)
MSQVRDVPTYAVMEGALYIHDDMVMIGPGFPRSVLERVPEMQPKEGDVVIAGYPKSGNFWTMEVAHQICNSANGVEASTTDILERVRMLEFQNPMEELSGLDYITQAETPRLMSTHLPGRYFDNILSQGLTKVVNIIRDPRDVLVSYFHFLKTLVPIAYSGNLAECYQHFKKCELPFGDYFRHCHEWKLMQEKYPNQVMILTYEDMKGEQHNAIRRLSNFLGHPLSQEKVDQIAYLTEFSQMKENKNTTPQCDASVDNRLNNHCRKGVAGGWLNELPNNIVVDFEDLMRKNADYYGMSFECQ